MVMEGQKVIFHIDVNSAFLSWEAVYRMTVEGETNDLRLVPSIVGGDREKRHGVVLAKSYPAKKFGIVTGEPITQALQKCPDLLVVPSRHHIYEYYSSKFMNILKEYSPVVEQYSIDEAFVKLDGISMPEGCESYAHVIADTVMRCVGIPVSIGIASTKTLAKIASHSLINAFFSSNSSRIFCFSRFASLPSCI